MALDAQVGKIVDKIFKNTLIPGLPTSVPVILTKKTSAKYTPSTGAVSGSSEPIPTTAIIKSYNKFQMLTSGGKIIMGDVRMSLKASDGASIGDQIEWNSVAYTIVAPDLASQAAIAVLAGSELMASFQCRKG